MILSKSGRQDIALICLNCYHHLPVRFEFSLRSQSSADEGTFDSFNVRHEAIYGHCPKCASDDIIFVDNLLEVPITRLNQLGYQTSHCCEGHMTNYYENVDGKLEPIENIINDPYVRFRVGRLGLTKAKKLCSLGDKLNRNHRVAAMVIETLEKPTDQYVKVDFDDLEKEVEKAYTQYTARKVREVTIEVKAVTDIDPVDKKKELDTAQHDFLQYLNELVRELEQEEANDR